MNTDKRLIEESFPVKEVSLESAKEKSIRHGHISTLHIWWARRPLASSRATSYAALIPPPKNDEEWQKQRNFIIELSKWENSNNLALIDKARADILKANGGIPPKILDPFGGGGSIPLEVLRLGCETYSNDYNPVAVLIQKCTLEYPEKYGHRPEKNDTWGALSGSEDNPLLADVKKWGWKILEEVKKEIGKFYPPDSDGSIPIGYLWARTIECQNPTCGAEIPLIRQFWLAKKDIKKVALFPYVENGLVKFKIVGDGYEKMPDDFDPDHGTVARAVAICPCCGSTVDAKTTRRLFQEGKSGERMTTVILHKPGTTGKKYRLADEKDMAAFREAAEYLENQIPLYRERWGIEPVPDEQTPEGKGRGAERAFSVRRYGLTTWGDLFNLRQKIAIIIFIDKIRNFTKQKNFPSDDQYSKVIATYLAILINRTLIYCSNLGYWHVSGEKASPGMQRQAIGLVYDYFESIPISPNFGFESNIDWVCRVIDHCSQVSKKPAIVTQNSATNLQFGDDFFDAVFTDPPYYDNVPYSYLSDFFYVWLKRSIGDQNPDLFATSLTPKKNEIVAYSNGPGGFEEGKQFFEDMLKKSFKEIHRVLKPNGVAIIVYAHKSTEGWETLINSLLDSGLIMTGAWPISTEWVQGSVHMIPPLLPPLFTSLLERLNDSQRDSITTLKKSSKSISTKNSIGFGTKGSPAQISSSRQLVPPLRSLESMSR